MVKQLGNVSAPAVGLRWNLALKQGTYYMGLPYLQVRGGPVGSRIPSRIPTTEPLSAS